MITTARGEPKGRRARTTLLIEGLRAAAGGSEILHGIDLEVSSGEVHAVMGPNGAGKSTLSGVVMGKPGYEVLGGSVTLDGQDVLAMAPFERAVAGLYLAMQYPTEVPGVRLDAVLTEGLRARGLDTTDLLATLRAEAARIGFDERFLERPLNVDLSGGEKKPDFVHILVKGRIVASGGPELAEELERDGYRAFAPVEAEPARRPMGPD